MTVSMEQPVLKTEDQLSGQIKEEDCSLVSSPEGVRILKERTEKLARHIQSEDENTSYLEFTEFMVSMERYGMENRFVKEVFSLKAYTCLPGVPAYVLGIVNLRGRILSVLDTRILFQLPGVKREGVPKVIVLRDEEMEFGILADSIIGVRRYPEKDLESTLPTLGAMPTDFLKGITKDRMTLIDGGKLMKDHSIIVHDAL